METKRKRIALVDDVVTSLVSLRSFRTGHTLGRPAHGYRRCVDALISSWPCKAPFTHEAASPIIIDGRGSQFDPDLVDVFWANSGKFDETVRRLRGTI